MNSKEYQREYYLANRERKLAALTPEKLERKRAYCRAYSKARWLSRGRTEVEKVRNNLSVRKYHLKNLEKCREYSRKWHSENRDRVRNVQRAWNKANHDRKRATEKSWRLKNLKHQHEKEREYRRKLKMEMISAYGGGCSCCGEIRFEFLSVDHINGRNKHGHSKAMSGIKLYAWLRRNGYPKEGFRCLCLNCNTSFGFYGYCPHERERQQQTAAD